MTKEKGFIDSLLDVAENAMDGIEQGLSTVETDNDEEETPIESPRGKVIDVVSREVSVPRKVLMWGLVNYAGHPPAWHLFDGVTNVAMCGDTFESVGRRQRAGVESDDASNKRARVHACWNCINRGVR